MSKPISPLRQRMIDDMTMRNLSPNTQETYIRSVAQFSAFHRRSPDELGIEHLRAFHLHLVSRGLAANSIGVKMAALRFLYGTTLRRPSIAAEIPVPRRTDHLPTVLAREEVERLLKAVGDRKLRTALMTIYSAGLRISEAMRLTAHDIDSAGSVRSFVYGISVKGGFGFCPSRIWHQRDGWPLCLAAPSGQAPKPDRARRRRGA
jgi:integrase/recombinase XerD